MSKLTPEQISNLIKEEDEDKELSDHARLLACRQTAQLLSNNAKELVDFLDNSNVRGTRAILTELSGEIEIISDHINALAKKMHLVDLKVP